VFSKLCRIPASRVSVVIRPGFLFIALIGTAPGPARATEPPAYVIPGKAGVPVMINGFDASYTVVEGDRGLDRPGAQTPTIVYGPRVLAPPLYYGPYFPALGRRPGYGRYEIEPPPNRRLPPPAESYHREWSSQSGELPADMQPAVPPPPIVVAPEFDNWRRSLRKRPRK
jgi:hypothetical protein